MTATTHIQEPVAKASRRSRPRAGLDSGQRGQARWWRRLAVGAALVAIAAALCVVWIDRKHDFAIDTEQITFTYGGDTISGTLALPRTDGPHGLVVFIHGDGPINADHDGEYRPIWESFARAGYASLSWDSPGVGRSEGDWLEPSLPTLAASKVAR